MTFRGRVEKGVVVLHNPKALPEGTEVSVRALHRKPPRRGPKAKVSKGLLRLSGAAKNLPADASRNIDHYLYGHSNR